MAGNKTLNKAREAKQDEFYTQIADVENELKHYKEHFRGKTIFLNCDDPQESNFWKYFELNFTHLGLKKLVSTHFDAEKPTYKLELVGDINGDGVVNGYDIVRTDLKQNGDFRSPESVEILKEADIVITNPPFSLFKEYLAQLIEHEKKFVILGNQNEVKYKEIFPLIQDNRLWLGYNNGDMKFKVPDYYEPRATRYWQDEAGQKWRSFGNMCWFSNLDIAKRHEDLILYETYTEEKYPKYANYDAIEVSKVSEIPCDYYGAMGVPITFLNNYNPEQFELIGMNLQLATPMKDIAEKGTFQQGGRSFYTPNPNEKDKEKGFKYHRCYDRFVIKRKAN